MSTFVKSLPIVPIGVLKVYGLITALLLPFFLFKFDSSRGGTLVADFVAVSLTSFSSYAERGDRLDMSDLRIFLTPPFLIPLIGTPT